MRHDARMHGVIVIGSVAISYLAGAIPFSFIFARLRGVDLRTAGSGNIGATNVFRTVGKGWGLAALSADLLKGLLPASGAPILGERLFGPIGPGTGIRLGLLCGAAAVAGHTWPVFLRFRGGKGVATSAGVLLGVAPAAMGVGLLAWGVLFGLFGYVSLASIGAAIGVVAAAWPLYAGHTLTLPITLSLLGLLVIIRHRSNLDRLFRGVESRAWRGLLQGGPS